MAYFEIGMDLETSDRAGMHGYFQIDSITKDDVDVTDQLSGDDMGQHYSLESTDDGELRSFLSQKFDLPENDIDYELIPPSC